MWYHYYDGRTELEHLEYELGLRYCTDKIPDERTDKRELLRVWQVTPGLAAFA